MERILPGFAVLALFGLMLMLSHAVYERSKFTERLFRVGKHVTFLSLVGFVLTLFTAIVLNL